MNSISPEITLLQRVSVGEVVREGWREREGERERWLGKPEGV